MNAQALVRQGLAFDKAGNHAQAERLYNEALETSPDDVTAQHLLGLLCLRQGRAGDAARHMDKALALRPQSAEILANHALAMAAVRNFEAAVASFNRFLALQPRHVEALHSRALALAELERFAAALADYDAVLALDPGYSQAWYNRGLMLWALARPQEAFVSYTRSLALDPGSIPALYNSGHVLQHLGRQAEALAAFEAVLAKQPAHVDALYGRGIALWELGWQDLAEQTFQTLLHIAPDHDRAFEGLAHAALHRCDWPQVARLTPQVMARARENRPGASPFTLLGYLDDSALQLAVNRRHAHSIAEICATSGAPLPARKFGAHGRIRLAYLSGDFHRHATALLTAELFERHDRSRFEITAISFGPDDGTAMRARLMTAFDRFLDVRQHDDRAVAQLLTKLEIDIAVDLGGYTMYARPGILGHRPCPVQVAYLGFPATMGADFIDYVIADHVILPDGRQQGFTEKIVRLPDCYQVNDSTRAVPAPAISRAEAGLPETGFIFCCFNNSWKITAPVFDVWMRLLMAVPGSVLWLLAGGAADNLRRAAQARGIDPARLIFAPRMAPDEHLARHRLADLFLDTQPYNAHTTASDALWAGLPLVTCMGESFCARVAASILTAAALQDLVTHTLEEYEALALTLAREPQRLKSIRHRLLTIRKQPLFDTDRFRQRIEQAYIAMAQISRRGEQPYAFDVESEERGSTRLQNSP